MVWKSVVILLLSWISLMDGKSYRLPDTVIPSYYTLEIITHLGDEDNFNFYGKVWIQANVIQETKNITLHSKGLDIKKEEVTVKDTTSSSTTKKINLSNFEYDTENEFFIIYLADELPANHKIEIFLSYEGKLLEGLAGFYKSSYTDNKTKEKRYLATTQFEATDARRAFPCFDEPAMKAKFKISLGRSEKYTSLSNMPLEKTEPMKEKDHWFWDRYEESVPMSTYLIAFIVSDFGYKQSENMKNNVTFRIWARKDALDQVDFASVVGPKALQYFEDFFEVKYPLPKQDMIAIPDFSAGAMENWGLITYRESYLLYDTKVSSATSQDAVASVIAHELAHQWFGNLVTMKWWTDLWLNEGFATYMSSLAEHHLFPQWNSLQEEVVNNMLNVFSFDALKSSHPVSVPIGNPSEIDEIFDTISYKKGSSLIRMMSLFLGEETLRKGVSNYLKKHEYQNAEQDDLWDSLTLQAHQDDSLPKNLTVKTVMDSWTVQTGYPVITVSRDYDKRIADVSQMRFFRDQNEKNNKQTWWVPLSYTTQKDLDFNATRPRQWLSSSDKSAKIENMPDKDQWVIFNIQIAGIYKVNYDQQNWDLLTKTLKSDNFKDIDVLNRVQLIDDASDLAWVGLIPYKTMFNLLEYLEKETDYLPWRAALTNIGTLDQMMKRDSNYGLFKTYMRKALEPIHKRLGALKAQKPSEAKLDGVKHQVLVAAWACRFGVGHCTKDAGNLFEQFQNDPTNTEIIPKDLRRTVYCSAIKQGGEKEWDFLWRQYLASNVATVKSTILSSLGCTKEIWLLERYLKWSLDPKSGIRKQDASSVFGSVAASDVGFYVAKNFFYNNIKEITKYISSSVRRLSRYLSSLASSMVTEYEYEELLLFISSNNETFTKIKQGVDQSLERVRLNVQWQKQHATHLPELLQKYAKEE